MRPNCVLAGRPPPKVPAPAEFPSVRLAASRTPERLMGKPSQALPGWLLTNGPGSRARLAQRPATKRAARRQKSPGPLPAPAFGSSIPVNPASRIPPRYANISVKLPQKQLPDLRQLPRRRPARRPNGQLTAAPLLKLSPNAPAQRPRRRSRSALPQLHAPSFGRPS